MSPSSKTPKGGMDELIPLIADRVKKKLLERGLTSERPLAGGPCSAGTKDGEGGVPRPAGFSTMIDPATIHSPADLAGVIDHTLLKPDASHDELKKLCDEARRYHFYSVCVNTANLAFCKKQLEGSGVHAIAVVGFPLGAMTTAAKAFETEQAVREGAGEIDMVINIGALKAKDYGLVMEDIAAVVRASHDLPVKVILETGLLSTEEKIIACALSKVAGATFVKTSTGFSAGGATVDDIKLMRQIVGPTVGVKASGGIRNTETAMLMIKSGANRLGASASVAIVTGQEGSKKGY